MVDLVRVVGISHVPTEVTQEMWINSTGLVRTMLPVPKEAK
ncbi:MAG TPA: hypothetical protein VLF19_12700 [Methylomirabilota bacterium]|nr:hypothetical protein [Methylomirabilota bacterium]